MKKRVIKNKPVYRDVICMDCGKLTKSNGPATKRCPECAEKQKKKQIEEAKVRNRELDRQRRAAQRVQAERKKRSKGITPLQEVNEAAREQGLTYGQYMAKLREASK